MLVKFLQVKLSNVGENQYKADLYGDSITVQRTVTTSSCTYKLKDHSGRIVQIKKVKEEIDNILQLFNIQVGGS